MCTAHGSDNKAIGLKHNKLVCRNILHHTMKPIDIGWSVAFERHVKKKTIFEESTFPLISARVGYLC